MISDLAIVAVLFAATVRANDFNTLGGTAHADLTGMRPLVVMHLGAGDDPDGLIHAYIASQDG